jgi:hypothetical protein
MLCLSTLSLGFLLSALFITQLINRDMSRASMTFLLGSLALLLQNLGCMLGGEFGGWLSLLVLITLIVLVALVQAGVLSSGPSILPNKCIPPSPGPAPAPCPLPPSPPPPCPRCPGVDPCPPPKYICGI